MACARPAAQDASAPLVLSSANVSPSGTVVRVSISARDNASPLTAAPRAVGPVRAALRRRSRTRSPETGVPSARRHRRDGSGQTRARKRNLSTAVLLLRLSCLLGLGVAMSMTHCRTRKKDTRGDVPYRIRYSIRTSNPRPRARVLLSAHSTAPQAR